jgi:serine O-acetyltransferase
MNDRLDQDFDAHSVLSFSAVPDGPMLANRAARVRRWFIIAFVESWLAVLLFRSKKALIAAKLPLLPGACDLLSRALFGVQIGNNVEAGAGLMITHGHVVIDGRTTIGRHCQISPWVTIGLSNSRKLGFSVDGPTIGDHVYIGTGAKVLGPVRVGDYARIGANAVVIHDVPENVTVVGIPARIVGPRHVVEEIATNGAPSDEKIASYLRGEIVEYRLHRQSLRTLAGSILSSIEIGSERLREAVSMHREDLVFLEAAAAAGGERTQQVVEALEAIDAALAPLAPTEAQPAPDLRR